MVRGGVENSKMQALVLGECPRRSDCSPEFLRGGGGTASWRRRVLALGLGFGGGGCVDIEGRVFKGGSCVGWKA